MKLENVLRQKLSRVRIKTKLMLVFLALIFITVGLVSLIIYQNTIRILENRVEQTTERAINQANSFLSYKLSNVKDVSSILFMNTELNDTLNAGKAGTSLSRQIDDYHKILNILRSAQNSREIYSIRLYVKSSSIYTRENSAIFALSKIEQEAWYKEMLVNSEGIYCRSTYEHDYYGERGKQNIVSCVRPLYSNGFGGEVLGVLSIDILEDTFQQIIKETQITTTGKVYLVDKMNRVISSDDPSDIGQAVDEVDMRSHIVINKRIDGTSWGLVAHIPMEEIYAESRQWSYQLYAVLFVVTIFGVTLAAAFSEGLTRRIGPLLQQIKKIESENWDSHTPVTSNDEIGVLQSHLNQMSENMRRLIQEKYKTEAEKKAAQLQALHAQINPHFLYNTLDLIHWMAMDKGAGEISDVAGQLSSFFRISLSQGRDVIPIIDELEHVRTYLDIQNRRFGGQIDYTIDADPELLQLKTVKLILQPVVENAVLHGIREKRGKSGCIRITCYLHGDKVEFTVEDDGVGISKHKLNELNSDSLNTGYGIRNVKDKLKLYFGKDSEVTYEPAEQGGTRVRIRIPVTLEDIKPREMGEEAYQDNKASI
ncbi:cache domain-containing sensor histidine kinase [Paenibacillus abyssi]|uniref:histidine kinase n=1 Tax=Paenibacillus abyssi TaxID=1340531 RepID=A0A917G0S9_9BACL|nr:sensor histidine kinase [Paenibacillus abyssi]GGG17203.1 histidine kinase [Paenibacillus abyssi]